MNIRRAIVAAVGIGAILSFMLFSTSAFSATVFQGYQGGTGIGTATTSDVGKVLTVSSSSPFLTYDLQSVLSSININGLTGSLFNFVSGTGINIATSSTSTITITNSSPSQWTTTSTGIYYNGGRVGIGTASPDHALTVSGNGHFMQGIMVDNLVSTSSYFLGNVGIGTTTPATTLDVNGSSTIRGNQYYPALGSSGALVLTTNGLVATSTYVANNTGDWAGTWQTHSPSYFQTNLNGAYVSSFNGATGTITGVNSVNGATGTVAILAGTNITIATTTTSTIINTRHTPIQWTESDTSSTNTYFIPIFTFNTTSTITSVWENSPSSTSNTFSYNLFYSPTNSPSSSMFKVFSSDRTVGGTLTGPTSTTSFASSTPGAGNSLWLYSYNASTTATTLTIYYQ